MALPANNKIVSKDIKGNFLNVAKDKDMGQNLPMSYLTAKHQRPSLQCRKTHQSPFTFNTAGEVQIGAVKQKVQTNMDWERKKAVIVHRTRDGIQRRPKAIYIQTARSDK